MNEEKFKEALNKILSMKLEPEEGHNYKYAFNRCWHLAHDALNAAGGEEKRFTLTAQQIIDLWDAGATSVYECIKPEGPCGFDDEQHDKDKKEYLLNNFQINF